MSKVSDQAARTQQQRSGGAGFGVAVHYRGVGQESRMLAAVPVVGAYLDGPGQERRLWRVSAVVFSAGAVEVFAVEVSAALAAELTAAWSAWDEAEQNQLTNAPQ